MLETLFVGKVPERGPHCPGCCKGSLEDDCGGLGVKSLYSHLPHLSEAENLTINTLLSWTLVTMPSNNKQLN